MTDLINQITINGKTTNFLNYINPAASGESFLNTNAVWASLFTAQLTSLRYTVTTGTNYNYYLRFNVPWETLSGQVSTTNYRAALLFATNRIRMNSTGNTSGTVAIDSTGNTQYSNSSPYAFAVINDYAMAMAFFTGAGLTTLTGFAYVGWTKDGAFTERQFPRNLACFCNASSGGSILGDRVSQEGLTTKTTLLTQNPTLSCAISTPGADSAEILIRDSASPNNYIGNMWHTIMLPSAAVNGKVYKNIGIDPDTGNVETDQKAFWLCVGSWGSNKIGMRVWTENIT
jgi:hypothetical protein